MTEFIEVPITTNETTLVDEALERLREEVEERLGVSGWEPNEGDLDVILLNVIGPMALLSATIASSVPPAIFRDFGTELVKTPYNEGAAATASTAWTLTDTAGHTIPAGTTLTIGELAFYVQEETSVPEGSSTATIEIVAGERGTEYNKLSGVLSLVNSLDWVSEVVIVGETSGGADQEEDSEYQNRLAAALALQAPRPITAANFAEMALNVPSSVVPTGVKVGRATAIDGYDPAENTFTGTTTESSKTLSEVSSFTGLTAGSELSGSGIPTHTTVSSVNVGAKTLVMSVNATANHSKESIKAIGSYENERFVTTFVTDDEGKALDSEAMEAIEEWLKGFRELNFESPVRAATYTEVFVTFTIHVLPGYTAATVVANVKAALRAYLNPETWGNPSGTTTGSSSWLNSTQGFAVVRYNSILGVIEGVQGVAYVPSGSGGLAIGTAKEPSGTVDLTLYGPAPLAKSSAESIVGESAE